MKNNSIEFAKECLEKILKGHWEAGTYDSHDYLNNFQWGNFDNEEEALKSAKERAKNFGTTSCEGYSIFIHDEMDIRSLVKQALDKLNEL